MVSDEKILNALLCANSAQEAAKQSGISRSTIQRRLSDPAFRERYYAAQRDLLKDHTAALQGHMGTAIEVMADVMTDQGASAQTRLNAADAVIRNSLKLTEQTDILRRLEALEGREK